MVCCMHAQYAEAKVFQMFLAEGRVISSKELAMVSRDECALAACACMHACMSLLSRH